MQVVKNRIISRIRKIFSVWIFFQIGVVFSANAGDIIITEFFYNKSAGNLPEYVELFNSTDSNIDLNGWKVDIDGIQVEIDATFNIDSHGYGVILSSSGLLRDEGDTTYCSSVHYGGFSNVCETQLDNLFWREDNTFSDLSNSSGSINKRYEIGDIIMLNDHINIPGLCGINPLIKEEIVS